MRQSERHHMHAPRGRLTRILLAIMAALLVGLARPTRAQAAVTLTKDGLESADRATCVIDVDSYQDFTFEASEGSPFRLDTRDGVFKEYVGGTEHVIYGVYVDYTPQAGVTTLPGYFEITYPKGLLDADGNRHDLHVRFSNVIYKWARSPQTGPVAQQLIGATDDGLRIMAECSSMLRDSEVVPYDPWSTGTVNPFGVSCDIRMWCDDDATLLYNVYARDIDQPDRFTGRTAATCSYEGEWSESLEPLGTFESFHVHKDSWLRSDGIRIRGTKSDNDEALNRSGFVGLGTMSAATPLGFVWRGSMCSSHILQDWRHTLKTRVVDGVGGTIDTKAGSESQRTIKSNAADTWDNTNTVPKNDYVVTATPAKGYRIAEMWLDDKRLSDKEASAGAVSIPSVTADHTVAVRFEPLGTALSLVKASAAPAITDGNPCYSLKGAEYGVYSDKECTKAVGSLVTSANGTSNSLTLPAGSYYVKETKPSAGYALDPTVHEAKVGETGGTVLDVTERPQTNPLSLLALKVDAQTKKAQPQGAASLAEAQFTVCYYNALLTSDKLPKDPTRTWVLKTDNQGRASLDEAHKVSGDPFFQMDGTTVVPLGTLTIEETKAPKGYMLPKDSLTLYQITPKGTEATLSQILEPSEANPTVLEQVARGGIKVKKVDAAGKPLAGATFSVTTTSDHPVVVGGKSFDKGAVCATLTTGEDGIASTSADTLPYGTYRITESKAPKGYQLNEAWAADVTIGEDAYVADLTKEPVTNTPISVSVPVTATKRLEGTLPGQGLKADAYSFTLSAEDGTVLQTKRNDAKGSIRFDALSFTHDDLGKKHVYLIREVAGDDDGIVYDGHVERFEIALEEQGDGSLKAEVKADRDGLVFVNEVLAPIALPVTGRGGIFGAWAAAAASGIAIGIYLRRRTIRSRRP